MENEKEIEKEIEKYHSDWISQISNYFADAIGLMKKEKEKQPEKSLEEIKKEIQSKTIGELVLFMSKEKK